MKDLTLNRVYSLCCGLKASLTWATTLLAAQYGSKNDQGESLLRPELIKSVVMSS